MTFDYEDQMAESAMQWLKSLDMLTKREFFASWGICDLVGCSFREENIKKRLALGQSKAIGSYMRLMILSGIPNQEEGKSITIQRLKRKFSAFYDETTVAREVDRLVKDKFVQITSLGALNRLNGWLPLHKKIVALELKLTRISDALQQAVGNLGFADESFVGVPIEVAQRIINTRKRLDFVQEGIGLLGINSAGCKVLLKPTPNSSHRNQIIQMHCVERFWRAFIKGN